MGESAPSGKKKLLWIGWDGADWEHINPMLDAGLLPTLERFIDQGAMGNLATMNPMLSPMLWNSAATGKYPQEHGIVGFVEPDSEHGGARPFSSHSRKCKAVWNICSQNGLKSNVINWWASHPAEPIDGCVVSNLISGANPSTQAAGAAKNLVHPEEKTGRYLKNRVLPSEITSEQLLPFCPQAAKVDQDTDPRLETLAKVFAEMLTTHAIATDVMEHEPWEFMAVYYTAIDHFSHAFMEYHPPRMRNVPEEDFEIFKDVVTGCYQFSDMMLERLLSLCDADTTVLICSDHGFQSRDQRPLITPREPAGPAIWHREYGIFAINGPGIKKDALIHGANLVDIAPTILSVLGLPIGQDMQGRPLLEVFESPPEVEYIPSWEEVDGNDGMVRNAPEMSPAEASELVKQFVALGYIEDPGENREKQQTNARVECQYNLARSLMFTGDHEQARELLSQLTHEFPWETRFIVQWVAAASQAGFHMHCLQLIEAAYDLKKTPSLQMVVMWCDCKVQLRQTDSTVRAMLEELSTVVSQPMVLVQIAAMHLRLRNRKAAQNVLLRALEINGENSLAMELLARVYFSMGKNELAINTALNSLALSHRSPDCHLTLGMALARSGDYEKSVTALQTVLKFSARRIDAHRWLVAVHRRLGNDDQMQHHLECIKAINQLSRSTDKAKRRTLKFAEFPIPVLPSEVDRMLQLDQERPPRYNSRARSGKTRIIVSGLPRSGTSLMMQMLEAGGLAPKTDNLREADVDNPRGYYEWEDIKNIKHDYRILDGDDLDCKAIKAISMLLPDLPTLHDYKVIYLMRPIKEVVASQTKMLENGDQMGGDLDSFTMGRELTFHRARSLAWLRHNQRVQHIEIAYHDVISDPETTVKALVDFLGSQYLSSPEQMAGVVDPSLYRQRQ